MLQITELLPVEGGLAGLKGAPGLPSSPIEDEEAVAKFASLLDQAGPDAGVPIALTGEELPVAGKELPPQPDSADLLDASRPESELPVVATANLVMPEEPAPVVPFAQSRQEPVPSSAVAGRDKELATIQSMLPSRAANPAPVAVAVADAVPAPEKITAPFLPVVPGSGPRSDARLTGRAGPPNPLPQVVPLAQGSLPVDAHGEALDPAVIRAAVLAAEDLAAQRRQPVPSQNPVTRDAVPAIQAMPAEPGSTIPLTVVSDGAEGSARSTPIVNITATPLSATAATDRPASTLLPQAAPVEVPVGDNRWGNAVGERVLWMTAQKMHTAEIRMNPAELGPLTVEVKMDDGHAHVTFSAQHAATREALEQALPRLRELFASEGLSLSNADVTEQNLRQGRGEQAGKDGSHGRNGDPLRSSEDEAEGEPQLARRASDGLVDTFA